jgi:hypothetical protein
VKKEQTAVTRNREHPETRPTVEKLLVILRRPYCWLIYNNNVSPGLLRRRADVCRILHLCGNDHPGVQCDNVCDHIEKHPGHAGKQDTNAPHRRFLAPVSTEGILLELTLDEMHLEAGIRMPEDRESDGLVGRAHRVNVSYCGRPSTKKAGFTLSCGIFARL